MTRLLRRLVLRTLAAAFLLGLVSAGAAGQEPVRLTFLHTNDNYEIAPTRGWGGFAQLMTLLKEQRALSPNTLVTFGGDLLSPSIMSGLLKGAQMIELMNAVGTDLAVLGNHEFDFGPEVLAQRLEESRFPWLATNVTRNGQPFKGTTDLVVRDFGGIKVGFFGIVTPETAYESSPGPTVAFAPYRQAATDAVKRLKEQGAEVVVAFTHLNFLEDRELARTVPGLALILGGHDHDAVTMLEGSTLIHKSGADARYLGVIDLFLTRQPAPSGPPTIDVTQAWRMIPVRGIAPDPEVADIVKRRTDQLDKELGVEIGTTKQRLDSTRLLVREQEAAIGNLIADAIRETLGAEVGLMNGGGIRGDRIYDAGTRLTRRDILTELPFGNSMVLLELKGADLLQALENGVSRVEERQGRFPHVSGLRFVYDPKRPPMQRVVEATVAGVPIDPDRTYRVATIDFLAAGGDGFGALAKGKKIIDASAGQILASRVMAHIEARKTVDASVEGRIQARP
ncbi:MAG: 5'-nucleotidase C-terminal domain-containing protein [Reyranellaceae bacterium]